MYVHVHLLQMERLLFLFSDCGDLLLASCAQDTFIRIWRVSSDNKVQEAEPEILCDKIPELKLTSNIFSVADKGVITNTYFHILAQYTVYIVIYNLFTIIFHYCLVVTEDNLYLQQFS